MFSGHWEILIVLAVGLLLFGNRLPSIARSIGESIHVFRRSVHGIDDETGPTS